ncbi:hypothetical protein ACLMAJ_32525 [Nocardia sp. KC 131]|uniref:hypothetical protein n=1 Tax=Nocardia arseniciresistens TaxID=3392119 RepID=UPI00398E33F0
MRLCDSTAAAVLFIGAVTLGTGVVHAEPAAQPTQPDIAYSVKLVDKAVVTTVKGGTFELSKALAGVLAAGGDGRLVERDGQLVDSAGKAADVADVVDVVDLEDTAGRTVLTLPLDFRIAATGIPVAPAVRKDGTVLELTPQKPQGLAITQPVAAKPVASMIEDERARNQFASQFGLATAIGGFVGTAVGATIGCVITIVAGCIGGFLTGAGIGGIIGTIIVGGPVLIAAGVDLVSTMMAAEGTTHWADKPKQVQPLPTQAVQTPEQPR